MPSSSRCDTLRVGAIHESPNAHQNSRANAVRPYGAQMKITSKIYGRALKTRPYTLVVILSEAENNTVTVASRLSAFGRNVKRSYTIVFPFARSFKDNLQSKQTIRRRLATIREER